MAQLSLKQRYLNGDCRVKAFVNQFAFMDYCYANHLTKKNSVTELDESTMTMYIARV